MIDLWNGCGLAQCRPKRACKGLIDDTCDGFVKDDAFLPDEKN